MPTSRPWVARERRAERPFAFLVSTTKCARGIRESLGAPAYSYYYVLEALAPALERFGTWQLVDVPESSLAFAALKAETEGYRPVHLALNPPQDCYFTPAVPTIVFPFWEFPDLPDRDFGHDTRQNWLRVMRPAALTLTACRFTADAFRRAGVRSPVAVVPVPLDPKFFDLPPWEPDHTWTFTCRHEVWGGEDGAVQDIREATATTEEASASRSRSWLLAKRAFRKVYPWLDPKTVGRITSAKERLQKHKGASPAKLAYLALRAAYRRTIRPWLSDEAITRITEVKNKGLALLGRSPKDVADPLLPSSPLTLRGLVYTSLFNVGDKRKNYRDLLSAFLLAFRDRPDATLVLKLATSPHKEHHEAGVVRETYEDLGISHRCRVVIITEYLNDEQMTELFRATTYYVNTSHAEGACLPLQRSLAGGRPGIAPGHTAMADYVDGSLAFVVRSHPEPTFWPHDPEERLRTERHRLVWSDLFEALRESAKVAVSDPSRYAKMAEAARRRMAEYASREVVAEALAAALRQLPDEGSGAFAWAS